MKKKNTYNKSTYIIFIKSPILYYLDRIIGYLKVFENNNIEIAPCTLTINND